MRVVGELGLRLGPTVVIWVGGVVGVWLRRRLGLGC